MDPRWRREDFPFLMVSIILSATNFAVMPDGIPVLGGDGEMAVPFLLILGFDMA
jgi:hypothetical protein